MKQAHALDAKNGNILWAVAISKDMENVKVAFEVLLDRKLVHIGHQFVQCHIVLDIKMEDFRQKARLATEGHMTKAPATITYDSVVSKETVSTVFMIAALEVKSGNILNVYVQAPVKEKVWTTWVLSSITML